MKCFVVILLLGLDLRDAKADAQFGKKYIMGLSEPLHSNGQVESPKAWGL